MQPLPPDSVFEHTGKTDTLLGYKCYHARRVVFSNTIDFWYAPALPPNTPYPSLGILDGAVLRVTVNDSYGYQAVRVNQERGGVIIPEQMGEKVTRQDYNYRLRENHVKKITVFDNEILKFW
ncbi:MAG: hypothetical protein U5L09_06885 [Bacteroidales bacterium]|nr:hypothetical protein [Bacteroidales bacterium]